MIVKGILDEDFVNYKKISMFIICHSCSFKCDKLSGRQVCQNGALAKSPNIELPNGNLVERYLANSITSAIVFGGLEPFDDVDNVIEIIRILRSGGNTDDVVIYTGYTEKECIEHGWINSLVPLRNIVVKFGRFIPDQDSHYDVVLGVKLASDNQYAKRIC